MVCCRAAANNRDPSCNGWPEKKGLVFHYLDRGIITALGLQEGFLIVPGGSRRRLEYGNSVFRY